jgi:hypothetical protein
MIADLSLDVEVAEQTLDVDSRNARFVFDAGSVADDNDALPAARHLPSIEP